MDNSCEDENLALQYATDIDLSKTPLNYEKFRRLAQNKNLSSEERIGFPTNYRSGYETAILSDIFRKLDLNANMNGTLLDIGCGASHLTFKLLEQGAKINLQFVLVDSAEMLSHIPAIPRVKTLPGFFPKNVTNIQKVHPSGYEYILCYSVLHYIIVDTNLFDFLDNVIHLLKPGGTALIGDIPNISKRKRFFMSDNGKAFHKSFMQTDQDPVVDFFKVEFQQIDDAILAGMIQRAQASGCDAYLLPQAKDLPMHNRRDDLLIKKP